MLNQIRTAEPVISDPHETRPRSDHKNGQVVRGAKVVPSSTTSILVENTSLKQTQWLTVSWKSHKYWLFQTLSCHLLQLWCKLLSHSKVCAEKVVNSDRVKRHHVVCCNGSLSANGGKCYVLQYFQSRYCTQVKNWLWWKKFTVHKVSLLCQVVEYEAFCCKYEDNSLKNECVCTMRWMCRCERW